MPSLCLIKRWRNIPHEPSNYFLPFPSSQKAYDEGIIKPLAKYSWNCVEVADYHGLQNNTHIWCVKQLDWYRVDKTWILLINNSYSCSKPLKIDENKKYNYSSNKLTQVVSITSWKSLPKSLKYWLFCH